MNITFIYSIFVSFLSVLYYANALPMSNDGVNLLNSWDAQSVMEKRRAARELFGKRTNIAPMAYARQLRRSRELFGKRNAPIEEDEQVIQPSLSDSLEVQPNYDQTLSYQMGRPVMLIEVPKEIEEISPKLKRRTRELFGKRSAKRQINEEDYASFMSSLSDRARRGRVNEFLG